MLGVRGALFASIALGALLAAPRPTCADEVTVPIDLQVELLERVAHYERTFAGGEGSAPVLVVGRAGSAESQRVTAQLVTRLTSTGHLGGRVITVTSETYTTAAALRASVDRSHTAIVYLAAGLGDDIGAIAAALDGARVMTVSAVGRDVDRGAVLGFELVSTRPRIAVNLARARAQHLQFNAQFLRLARVVE